jgi:hypothetical protein
MARPARRAAAAEGVDVEDELVLDPEGDVDDDAVAVGDDVGVALVVEPGLDGGEERLIEHHGVGGGREDHAIAHDGAVGERIGAGDEDEADQTLVVGVESDRRHLARIGRDRLPCSP